MAINNKTPNLSQKSKELGIPYATLYRRWREGRPIEASNTNVYAAFGFEDTMQSWAMLAGISTKNLYDRYKYYEKSTKMDSQEALEYVLTRCGLTNTNLIG
jgi:hypothetical protein